MSLGLGNHLPEHQIPFVVGMTVGVEPSLLLRLETGVRPQMVAVRGEMQPVRAADRAREKRDLWLIA